MDSTTSDDRESAGNVDVIRVDCFQPANAAIIAAEGQAEISSALTICRDAIARADGVSLGRGARALRACVSLGRSLSMSQWAEGAQHLIAALTVGWSGDAADGDDGGYAGGGAWRGWLSPRDAVPVATAAAALLALRSHVAGDRLLTVAWRPLWRLLRSVGVTWVNPAATLASPSIVASLQRALSTLVRRARHYFPAGAAAEICAHMAPWLADTRRTDGRSALLALVALLPRPAAEADRAAVTSHVPAWIAQWRAGPPQLDVDVTWARLFKRVVGCHLPAAEAAGAWVDVAATALERALAALRLPALPGGEGFRAQGKAWQDGAVLLAGSVSSDTAQQVLLGLWVRLAAVRTPAVADGGGWEESASDVLREGGTDNAALVRWTRACRLLLPGAHPTAAHSDAIAKFVGAAVSAVGKAVFKQAPLPAGWLDAFLAATLPCLKLGLFHPRLHTAAWWMKGMAVLADLRPALVTDVLVEQVALAVNTATSPHLLPNVLRALRICAPALLHPVPHLLPHLPRLLTSLLPALDASDDGKTRVALSLFAVLAARLPLPDSADVEAARAAAPSRPAAMWAHAWGAPATSDAATGVAGATDDDVVLPAWHGAGAAPAGLCRAGEADADVFRAGRGALLELGEWALAAVDRLTTMAESREQAASRRGGVTVAEDTSGVSTVLGQTDGSDRVATSAGVLVHLLAAGASPRLQRAIVRRVVEWALATPHLDSSFMAGHLLAAVAPFEAAGDLPRALCDKLAAAAGSDASTRWWLQCLIAVLAGEAATGTPASLALAGERAIALVTARASSPPVRHLAARLLSVALEALLRFSPSPVNMAPLEPADMAQPHTWWVKVGLPYSARPAAAPAAGALTAPAPVSVRWDGPTADGRAAALRLVNALLAAAACGHAAPASPVPHPAALLLFAMAVGGQYALSDSVDARGDDECALHVHGGLPGLVVAPGAAPDAPGGGAGPSAAAWVAQWAEGEGYDRAGVRPLRHALLLWLTGVLAGGGLDVPTTTLVAAAVGRLVSTRCPTRLAEVMMNERASATTYTRQQDAVRERGQLRAAGRVLDGTVTTRGARAHYNNHAALRHTRRLALSASRMLSFLHWGDSTGSKASSALAAAAAMASMAGGAGDEDMGGVDDDGAAGDDDGDMDFAEGDTGDEAPEQSGGDGGPSEGGDASPAATPLAEPAAAAGAGRSKLDAAPSWRPGAAPAVVPTQVVEAAAAAGQAFLQPAKPGRDWWASSLPALVRPSEVPYALAIAAVLQARQHVLEPVRRIAVVVYRSVFLELPWLLPAVQRVAQGQLAAGLPTEALDDASGEALIGLVFRATLRAATALAKPQAAAELLRSLTAVIPAIPRLPRPKQHNLLADVMTSLAAPVQRWRSPSVSATVAQLVGWRGVVHDMATALSVAPGAAVPPPTLLCADGQSRPSAAPLVRAPAVNWRVETVAGLWACVLLAGAPGQGARLVAVSPHTWLWAASLPLSDQPAARSVGCHLLLRLLTRPDAAASLAAAPHAAALLTSPPYLSQLVQSLTSEHAASEGGGGLLAAMMGGGGAARGADRVIASLGTSFLPTPVYFREGARSWLAGGVKAAIHHALLFQALAAVLPASIPALGAAVSDLVADVDPAAAATTSHDAATLQGRCAVAAAWLGGTLRALSASCDGSADGAANVAQAAVLDSVRTLLAHVNVAWIGEISNMLRFAARGRHPARLAPVYACVFRGAATHLADAAGDAPGPLEGDDAAWSALVAAATPHAAAPTATPAAAEGAPATAVSAVAVQRWVRFAGALLEEAAAVSTEAEGDGAAGWAMGSDTPPLPPLHATVTQSARDAAAGWAHQHLLRPLTQCLTHSFDAVRSVAATTLGLLAENGTLGGGWEWPAGALMPAAPSAEWLDLLRYLAAAGARSVMSDGAAGTPSPAQRALESTLSLAMVLAPAPDSVALPTTLVLLPTVVAAASHANAAVARKADIAVAAAIGAAPLLTQPAAVLAAVESGMAPLAAAAAPGAVAPGRADHATRVTGIGVLGGVLTASAAFSQSGLATTPSRAVASRLRGLLADHHHDVQMAARAALSPVLLCLPPAAQQVWVDEWMAAAAKAKPPKRPAAAATAGAAAGDGKAEEALAAYKAKSTAAARARTAAVVGLASVVWAHPHDLPSFLPPALAALARYATDGPPVGKVARDVVSEWRHWHSDPAVWETTQRAFDPDQLADVTAVGSGGTYFA